MVGGNSHGRFVGLDGLRGVAALIVVLHHTVAALTGAEAFHSGYLAVDFFFMLSGLVIAFAWEDRLAAGAPFYHFAASRWRRVAPVMAIGIAAGAAVALAHGEAFAETARAVAKHLMFVPSLDTAGALFPLDGVEWSLLLELFANALYATLLFRLPTKALIGVAVGAFLTLAAIADPKLGIGFGDCGDNAVLGIPRVLASYTTGVLLFRLIRVRGVGSHAVPYPLLVAALIAALVAPGLTAPVIGPRLLDPLVVLLMFPAIILTTCAAPSAPRWHAAARVGAAISFPLYAVHLPILDLLIPFAPRPGISGVALVVSLALVAAIAIALAAERRPAALRLATA